MAEHYCLLETELGVCGIAWTGQGLSRLQLPEADRAATERRLQKRAPATRCDALPAKIAAVVAQVRRYAAGEKLEFTDVDLELAETSAFHCRIYEALRRVGWGHTSTYGALAREVGAPDAARAVGQAMGRNPIPLIIPCHRVLASGDKVGGFSAFGGAITKQRLLALEGVHLGSGTPLLPGLLPAGR
jgi:methylated-DNA-[protein]-cysteine S-methyltransferase